MDLAFATWRGQEVMSRGYVRFDETRFPTDGHIGANWQADPGIDFFKAYGLRFGFEATSLAGTSQVVNDSNIDENPFWYFWLNYEPGKPVTGGLIFEDHNGSDMRFTLDGFSSSMSFGGGATCHDDKGGCTAIGIFGNAPEVWALIPAPEPASMAMLLTGVVGLAGFAATRRRKAGDLSLQG
ncbi:PEP-CTERM sorting domain-containing protein [Belnapia moabensis]|uniref:PEP-CTERM sorting domain-containing protein n=1 Tax=Belnapia moabensis TaxID=365533 RepID=UPI0005BE48D5|nr:PEP-CTERM sorting domain-containing protein [Belnapia moabensis]